MLSSLSRMIATFPVTISRRTTPKLKQSLFFVSLLSTKYLPVIVNLQQKPGVPQTLVEMAEQDSMVKDFESPKSETLAVNFSSSKMLLVFTSLWITAGFMPSCRYVPDKCFCRFPFAMYS